MASATSGRTTSDKDYEEQKKLVMKQKEEKEVNPRELYKLAALLARWKVNDRLPVCLLCQDVTKKPFQRGHVFPHSVLKEAGMDKIYDDIRGAESTVSKAGYFAFCPDCEKRFQEGERHFNPEFFKKLFHDTDNELEVTAQFQIEDNQFPWLFYFCVSLVWRLMCFITGSDDFFETLECLRRYLLNWQDSEEIRSELKLFIFVPNGEVDKRIQQDNTAKHEFFYETFHGLFRNLGLLSRKDPRGIVPKGRMGWIFCGPIHIVMYFACSPSPSYIDESSSISNMLTTETRRFRVENKISRLYPIDMYDQIVEWRIANWASTVRLLKGQLPASGKPSLDVKPTECYFLPKDVSYDKGYDEFGLPSMYEREPTMRLDCIMPKMTYVKAKRGRQKLLFVAARDVLHKGGAVALVFEINTDDKTLSYMKEVQVPSEFMQQVHFKEIIEDYFKDHNLF